MHRSCFLGEAEGYSFVVPKLKIREVIRSGSAFAFVVPRPDMWPKDDQVLVVTLQRNYTIHDYQALFKRIGCEWCWDMWLDNGMTLGKIHAPSVPVHCIYGSQLPTTEVMQFCFMYLI